MVAPSNGVSDLVSIHACSADAPRQLSALFWAHGSHLTSDVVEQFHNLHEQTDRQTDGQRQRERQTERDRQRPKRGNDFANLFAKKGADAHKPPLRIAKTMVACASLARQAARWAAEAHVLLRLRGWDDTQAAAPRTRTRPARARLKRKFKADAAAPASGKACDWLAPHVPSAISQGSLDPRSFRGHSLHLGHVFDAGGRALDRRIVFCAKCGALYWERADALCRSCKQHPGGCASQLGKLRAGVFPNKRYPGWTVELIRRPTLDEANTLAAQLESCEAGLGRSVWGPTTAKKNTCRTAGSGAAALGTRHWGSRDRGPGTEMLGRRSRRLHGGGSTLSWWTSSPSRQGAPKLARHTDVVGLAARPGWGNAAASAPRR